MDESKLSRTGRAELIAQLCRARELLSGAHPEQWVVALDRAAAVAWQQDVDALLVSLPL